MSDTSLKKKRLQLATSRRRVRQFLEQDESEAATIMHLRAKRDIQSLVGGLGPRPRDDLGYLGKHVS
jgi:hypothetical protein